MRALIIAFATLTAMCAHADWLGSDCQEFAERSAVQPAAGITRVVIIGRAGFLHVEGRAGATEIRATGHACAAIEELLVGIRLSASRSGSKVTIEAIVPKQGSARFASEPKLDFTVTLPAGIEVDVADTSGEVIISNVGNTRVAAISSNRTVVRKVRGNLTIGTPTSEIDVEDVRGDVNIPTHTSANIGIKRVSGSVTIDDRGSGAVAVSDIGGDFTLHAKKSGSVDYRRVSGRVSVPGRYRR